MEQDKLEGALDDGWKALDAGELARARAAAERALAVENDSPEGHTLRGAIAAAEGKTDEAIEAYERAMALDETYVEPRLLLAELSALEGDGPRALELCEEALDVAEEEDEFLDALLLKAEVELGEDDADSASATLAELPPVDLPSPDHHLRAGECFLELEELDSAQAHFEAALKAEPSLADSQYGLALVAEARGDEAARLAHFREVAALDRKAPRPSWAITHERLEELVEAALAELPEQARTLLGNVPILVEEYPDDALIADGLDPRLLGLFAGTPFPEQSSMGGPPHLERVFLFQRNIERNARTAEEVEEQIRITLLHETGHFFGLDEEDLAEMGLD